MSKSIVTIDKFGTLIFCFIAFTIPILVHGQESEASLLSTWVALDAPNGGLSWPGRYSHSPADLRDIAKLIDLIQAMAEAPEEI